MILDSYRHTLSESGKLKVRATALLAEGGDKRRFQAAVLFHAAARAERRALQGLLLPSAEMQLAAAIEQCSCLIEGLDPPAAAVAWGEVLDRRQDVPRQAADAMLSRITVKYHAQAEQFTLLASRMPPSSSKGRMKDVSVVWTRKEVALLLKHFPGVPGLWYERCRLAEAQGRLDAAWEALGQARALTPEDSLLEAMSLRLVPHVLTRAEVTAHLASTYGSIRTAGPEVCLYYALAELRLARGTKDSAPHIQRALQATIEGESRASESLRKYLRAMHMLLVEVLADREPTLDVLYRAGLGDVVLSSRMRSPSDPVRVLETGANQTLRRQPETA